MWDMGSGGSTKLPPCELIFVQELEDKAAALFTLLFDIDPRRVTCSCCGPNYAVAEYPSLKEAADWHIEFRRLPGLKQLLAADDVLVISQASLRTPHPIELVVDQLDQQFRDI
jgi:hypothetical protein